MSKQTENAKNLAKLWLDLLPNTDAVNFPLRKEMLFDKCLLPTYIEACQHTIDLSYGNPERLATFMIEKAHGLYRLETTDSLKSAEILLEMAQAEAEVVENEIRKKRLQWLITFHNIWGRHLQTGDFAKCADLYGVLIEQATDEIGLINSQYYQLLFLIWETIVEEGAKSNEATEVFREIEIAGLNFISKCKNTNSEREVRAEIIVNELTLISLGVTTPTKSDHDFGNKITKLNAWLFNKRINLDKFGPITSILNASLFVNAGSYDEAYRYTSCRFNDIDVESFARLLLCRMEEDDTIIAMLLDSLMKFNNNLGGHLYRAVAKQEFAHLLLT